MKNQQKHNILIVDDYKNWREFLRTLLAEEGYHVLTASSAINAKKTFIKKKFDVVILDIRLIDNQKYNVQGIGLLKFIKQYDSSVGVIILTGFPSKEQRNLVLNDFGADAYLVKAAEENDFKSFTITELCNVIIELTENRRKDKSEHG